MECDEVKDSVLLYAAGALEPEEAEMVRRHLAGGCPQCAGLLAEAEETAGLLPLALAPVTPPDGLKARLLGRIGAENSPMRIQPPAAPPMPWWAMIFIPAAIAAVVAAGLAIAFALRIQKMQSGGDPVALAEKERTIGVLTARIESDQQELTDLRARSNLQSVAWAANPDLKFLWLGGTDKQPGGSGARIFWDTDAGIWHFFAKGLKAPAAGKSYELWCVSADLKTKTPEGSFTPDSSGNASLVVNNVSSAMMPPNATIAAVTDEPADQPVTVPTGSFQLLAKAPAE